MDTLADVQRVADDISRLEEAVANVGQRESDITAQIDPPAFILKHYQQEFWSQVGAELSAPVEVPYPRYKFQYVSAGGNSSQESPIVLDTPTLDVLSATLAEKIRWTKSAAGQRALMTSKLRGTIKERDRYACRQCKISVVAEPHLLFSSRSHYPRVEGWAEHPGESPDAVLAVSTAPRAPGSCRKRLP